MNLKEGGGIGGLLGALSGGQGNPFPGALQMAQMPGTWGEGGLMFNSPNPLTHLLAPNQIAQMRYAMPGQMPDFGPDTMKMLGMLFNNLGMGGGALSPGPNMGNNR